MLIQCQYHLDFYHPAMSFGFGVGDILAASQLAARVYSAYRDAPSDYRDIVEDVGALQAVITNITNTNLSANDPVGFQAVLMPCNRVLNDLNALIESYNSSTSPDALQFLRRIRLGTEDTAPLRSRLTSSITLLVAYIQRFDIPTTYCYVSYLPAGEVPAANRL